MRPLRSLICLAPPLALWLTGCASSSSARLTAEYPRERAATERRLHEIFDAAAKRDMPRLDSYHAYGPKFTKFDPEGFVRQNAEAGREGEHKSLGAIQDLKTRMENLQIDVLGDTAIATFVLDYDFNAGGKHLERKARMTLVFVLDHGDWKITHEHVSTPRTP